MTVFCCNPWTADRRAHADGMQTLGGAGDQVESTKASAATVHFPAATRDAADKMFISQEHEKSGYGRDSPGLSAARGMTQAAHCNRCLKSGVHACTC